MKPLSEIQEGSHLMLGCRYIFKRCSTVAVVNELHRNSDLSAKQLAANITYTARQARANEDLSAMVIKMG